MNPFEFSEWMVSGRSTKKRRVVIIYSEDHPVTVLTFCSEFANYMESILLSKEQLLIVGDIQNIHVNDASDADARNFLDLLESLGLLQHVGGPIHIHGHTLDLVVTRLAENIILDTPKANRYLSDHAAILRKLTSSKPLNTVKVKYRRTKSVDISALSCDLGESSLCRDVLSNSHPDILSACDLDSLACNYNTTLSSVIESHAPLKTKTIVSRPTVPWYNDGIHKAKLLRRKAERKWKETKRETDFQLFKKRRNHVTHLLNETKRKFLTDFVEDNSSDQRRLSRATRRLLGKNDSTLSFPDYDDKSLLVNDIARFFARKIMRIRDQIYSTVIADMDTVPGDPIVSDAKILSEFKPLSEAVILALTQKSSKKTCNLDPMPTKLVVESLDHLLPVITKMINSSLLGGHFPKVWKKALIDPCYKKLELMTLLIFVQLVTCSMCRNW